MLYDLEGGGGGLVIKSCLTLVTPWQFPLSVGFSRQQDWSGLPFPSPGALLNPGIKPVSPTSSALQVGSLLLNHWGRPTFPYSNLYIYSIWFQSINI